MLPSVRGASKRVAISTEPTAVYTYYDLLPSTSQSRKCVDKTVEKAEDDKPILPMISEGSFTSLISSRSSKSLKAEVKVKEKSCQKEENSNKVKDLPSLLTSHSSKQMVRTRQLQLNCNSKMSVGGWVTRVNNPKLMQLQQLGQIQTGESIPTMSGSGLPVVDSRDHSHIYGKRKLQLTLSRTARVTDSASAGRFSDPLAGSVTVHDRVHQNKKQTVSSILKMQQEVTQPQSSMQTFGRDVPNPASQVTIVKFHRKCSCGRHHESSSSSTVSSRQNSQDKLWRRSSDVKVKPAEKPPPQAPARRKISKQVKKKVPKEPVLQVSNAEPARPKEEEVMTEKEEIKPEEPEKCCDEEEKMEVVVTQSVIEDKAETSVMSRTSPKSQQVRTRTPNLLKVGRDLLRCVLDIDGLSELFRKLDSNEDGHISFEELKKSLPLQLTRAQIYYFKKIYDMACESTYFGLDEFLGVQLMCKVITESPGSALSDIYSRMDLSAVETRFQNYMDLFSEADSKQNGVISVSLLQNVLSAALNVHTDSFLIQRALNLMNKAPGDSVYCAEFLVFVPFFVNAESRRS